MPLVAIEPLGDGPIDVSGYDWVVLTSANGARELRRRMRGRRARVAAIGRATAEAFGGADLIATTSTQEGLLAELPRRARAGCCSQAAEGARRLLPDALDADVVPLYRTLELEPAEWPAADLVVLTSPSAARALAALDARRSRGLDRARDDARRPRRRDHRARGGRDAATSTASSPRSRSALAADA